MRSNLRVPALLFALAALALAHGCSSSGGDDDDPGVDADPAAPDANPNAPDANTTNPPADAPSAATSMIGDACTPGETPLSQGSCDAGFVCVGLNGGAGTWCTKQCTDQADTSCQQGYSGAGFPICLLTVQDPEGVQPDMTVCVVMCEDTTGSNLCTTCDGSCPGSLGCHDTGNQWSACF